jgi:uncharacterized DUF497 family protein
VALANQKHYVSLYTNGAHHIGEFKAEYPRIKTGTGCINLKLTDPFPAAALKKVIRHAIAFDEAVTVFYDPLSATFDDPDHSGSEHRYVKIGSSSRGRVLVVAHAETGERIRIISARPATAHERKRHEG